MTIWELVALPCSPTYLYVHTFTVPQLFLRLSVCGVHGLFTGCTELSFDCMYHTHVQCSCIQNHEYYTLLFACAYTNGLIFVLLVCKAVLFVWTAHFDSLHRPHLPWAVCSKNWEDRQDSWSCGMARCVCMLYVIVDSYRYVHMHYKYYVLCNLRRNLRNPGIAQCISSVLMMCSNLKIA